MKKIRGWIIMKEKEIQQFRQSDHEIDPIFLNRWSPRSF